MLKGWLDRVWVPHATFRMPEPGKPIGRILTNIRFIAAVSTLGSPWWWWTLAMGEPGRRILLRGLSVLCAPGCRTKWLACTGWTARPRPSGRDSSTKSRPLLPAHLRYEAGPQAA